MLRLLFVKTAFLRNLSSKKEKSLQKPNKRVFEFCDSSANAKIIFEMVNQLFIMSRRRF